MLEPLLAFFHISAFIGWIVFATAQAVMCRSDWFNAAAVPRMVRLDLILWIATAAVLASALARIYWGAKGSAWYWSNPLLHVKLTLFLVAAAADRPDAPIPPLEGALDANGSLPSEAELTGARRLVMIATHLVAVIPAGGVPGARLRLIEADDRESEPPHCNAFLGRFEWRARGGAAGTACARMVDAAGAVAADATGRQRRATGLDARTRMGLLQAPPVADLGRDRRGASDRSKPCSACGARCVLCDG